MEADSDSSVGAGYRRRLFAKLGRLIKNDLAQRWISASAGFIVIPPVTQNCVAAVAFTFHNTALIPQLLREEMMASDLKNLQGSWSIESLEIDGRPMPADTFAEACIVIKGSQFTSTGMGAKFKGTVEVDEHQKPKTFDLVFTAGPKKGIRNPGIYQLDGDSWTICLATRGDKRPRTFNTREGDGLALEKLTRGDSKRKASKAKSRPARREAQAEESPGTPTELEGEWAMVSAVFNGKPMSKEMVSWCKRITRGNVTKIMAGPQLMLHARFTIDAAAARPGAIDYVNLSGSAKGKSQKGIFELRGADLSICMSAPDGPRPKSFSSKSGDDRSYTTWRLIKK